jgi:hypothetical protein
MTRPSRILPALLAALALVAGASACGYTNESKDVKEGEPVKLGDVQYNVVFSRFLNPHDSEDSAYLVGQPEAPPGSAYFGVFFEVQNESDEAQSLPDGFTIEDSDEGGPYEALPTESLYAFPLGGEVEAEEQIPVLDSTPQQGPLEGSLAIFLLPDAASENRPLTLEIEGPEGPAQVALDL